MDNRRHLDFLPPTAMRRALLLLIGWFLTATVASAASVTLHPNGNLVILEGRIEVGDFDKVEKLAREATPTGIYLASAGGNLSEAMRIGALVRRLAWETRSSAGRDVPMNMRASLAASYGVRDPEHNDQCTSACFFIFVSGIYRDGHGIGIHRPFMKPEDIDRLPADVAEKMSKNVQTGVRLFLFKMGVPLRYVDEMYKMPSEGMRWITDEEIAADFTGFIPEVRIWVKSQCPDDAETLRCKESVMTGIKIRTLQEHTR